MTFIFFIKLLYLDNNKIKVSIAKITVLRKQN